MTDLEEALSTADDEVKEYIEDLLISMFIAYRDTALGQDTIWAANYRAAVAQARNAGLAAPLGVPPEVITV